MGDETPEKGHQPLCIRLGYFSRKGLVLILVFFPLSELGYALLLAEDRMRLLETSMPLLILFWLVMLVLFFAGNWGITQLRNLYGIDFRSRKRPLKEQAHLAALFEGNSYREFQTSTYREFIGLEMPFIAFLISGILVFVAILYPFLTETDRLIVDHPEIVEGDLNYAYFVFRIVPLSIYLFWFFFSGLGGVLLLSEVVFSFHSLANYPGLSLNQANRYFEFEGEERQTVDFSQKSEIVKFSLKRFKRRSKGIPEFLLRINVVISICLALIGLYVFFFVSAIENEQTQFVVIVFGSGVIILLLLINLFLFIFPQFSLHSQLEGARNSMIEAIEEIYELKKIQYLQIAAATKTAKEDKELLWLEMQALIHLTEELESILTWPFNYPQLATLIGGSLLALIPVILQAVLQL